MEVPQRITKLLTSQTSGICSVEFLLSFGNFSTFTVCIFFCINFLFFIFVFSVYLISKALYLFCTSVFFYFYYFFLCFDIYIFFFSFFYFGVLHFWLFLI